MTAPLDAIDPALRHRAMHPTLLFGPGSVEAALGAMGEPFLLVSQPEPLAFVPPALRARAAAEHHVTSLSRSALEAMDASLPAAGAVVGLGGGSAMDAAKYLAWKRGIGLYLAPNIVSVDAFVTNTIAVRERGQVRYEGFVVADQVLIDLDLIRRADPRLNRAGVGDLLSIHTALWDWEHGGRHTPIGYDPSVAERSRAVCDRIAALAPEIRAVSDAGLEAVVRGYA